MRYHGFPQAPPLCGCFIIIETVRKYLPQVSVSAHTTILASTSRTTLTQTFTNPHPDKALDEIRYIFPLYDGVSVVAFTCTVGKRVIKGVVKEREKAKQVYKEAKARGETAGLLEQSFEAADVFTTTIGNVPAGEEIKVEITYLGELKHDAEVDGVRFTIPTNIVPRYGEAESLNAGKTPLKDGGFSVTIDAEMPDGSAIKSVQSPSHPISVNIGTLSTAASADPSLQKASATLSLGSAELEKDFVIQVVATNLGNPTAILETHPTIPNQRALMATLVPKFNLPTEKPEIVFICDRSGSMYDKVTDLKAALRIFLKSLPVGVKFNICSFGTRFSFLWSKSKTYSQESLDQAIKHIETFESNFGGTEMYEPVKATFKQRYKDMNLEVFLLTDGEIWDQDKLFGLINKEVEKSKGAIRVFTLGVGSGASTALIEGAARAGRGFAQSVSDNEKMDKKVVRMLKGSLFPHVTDYSLEIKYEKAAEEESDDDFEVVEKVMEALDIGFDEKAEKAERPKSEIIKKTISLFQPNLKDDDTEMTDAPPLDKKYDHLPTIDPPRYLQTPFEIPPLFPFNRTTVYVLLSDSAPSQKPKSVILKGTSNHGPLELEIPITILTEESSTIHQLAARKEVKELEEGRGWITHAKEGKKLLKEKYEGRFSDMVEREAVRLGVKYQVGGKWCSFVAVQANDGEEKEKEVGEAEVLKAKDAQPSVASIVTRGYAMNSMPRTRGGGPMFGGAAGGLRMASAAHPPAPMVAAPSASYYAPGGGGIMAQRSAPLSRARKSSGSSSGMSSYKMEMQCAAAAPLPDESDDDLFGAEEGFASYSPPEPICAGIPPPPAPNAEPNVFGSALKSKSAGHSMFSPQLAPQPTGMAPQYTGGSFGQPASTGSPFGQPAGTGNPFAQTLGGSSDGSALFGSVQQPSADLSKESKKKKGGLFGNPFRRESDTRARSEKTPSPPRSSVNVGNPLEALIGLQTFAGSWTWSRDLETILGVTAQKAGELKLPSGVSGDVLATLCAVVYFKKKLPAEKETWEMVVEKAEGWLAGETGDVEGAEKVVEGLF